MTFAPGQRFGACEIVAPLGAGGMGEVYRARDTKLNRDVAIKVLLPAVASDPDRLARFSREAQVLASLNHPNIAHIHGLEEANGVTALVLEFVDGEDLAQRIARGPIPIDEALPIARQIADALEAAHDLGIIHRDLKPADIKVRAEGTVKVLDFGLAKAIDPTAGSSATAMNSPTLSIHATEAGIILGTAAYMSPEQAAGKTVDKRTDLWAFGVVLMEMLTGRQVFKGETVSHVIASVLKDDPDWTALPPATPAPIHKLLRRCLETAVFSASKDGAVAYVPLIASEQALVQTEPAWRDRDGRITSRIEQAAGASRPVLSPDARRLGMLLRGDIWILELGRAVLSRATSSGVLPTGAIMGGQANHLTWLPDSQRMMFTRAGFRNGKDAILETLAGSGGKETIIVEPADDGGEHAHLTDISADGRYLTFEGGSGNDIWVMPITEGGTARAFVAGPGVETQGMFSPDGGWVAYTSDLSGRYEIFVQSFPQPGTRVQVSPDGGANPRWRPDGKELFYMALDRTLMAVPVRSARPIEFGRPTPLFQFYSPIRGIPAGKPPYDVMPGGERFIVSSLSRRTDSSLNVLLNWPALVTAVPAP